MSKRTLTPEQKKLDIDIWIIAIASLAVLVLYMAFNDQIVSLSRDGGVNILWRVLVVAGIQFCLAGLGIVIVSVIRKENLFAYDLRAKGALLSIFLCVLCFIPNIIFSMATGELDGYLPFQGVWTTKDVLASGFPFNALGMILIAVAWGFFEGYNYVVISDKINKRYPSKSKWLNWGAIVCAVLCVLIHGAIGVTPEGIIEMLTILCIIYGMLMVKEFTNNAWGCVFVFVFLWNAF